MADKDENKTSTQTPQENVSQSENITTRRMQVLKDVMNKTLQSLTNSVRLIKPIANTRKEVLKELHTKTVAQFEENVKTELHQMYNEENIEYLLNNIDRLVHETNPEQQPWAPSGDVQTDIRAHVVSLKREKLKVLEKSLRDLEAKNKMLVDKVTKSESHLLQTKDKILATVEDFEELNEANTYALKKVEDIVKPSGGAIDKQT